MKPERREEFLLMPNGRIIPCGRLATSRPTQVDRDKAIAWCFEGGHWAPMGSPEPTTLQAIPWACERVFCPRFRSGVRCGWWIDPVRLVHCDLIPPTALRPSVHAGGPDDPPMVLSTCRVQALAPIRLASGLVLPHTDIRSSPTP